MARRKTRQKRRTTRSFSFINALEAYTYANILSQGIMGSSPLGFLTGAGDIAAPEKGYTAAGISSAIAAGESYGTGADQISLTDLLQKPAFSLAVASTRAQSNLVPMALNGLLVGASFKAAKALLRRPISNVNRNIMKPMFGKSVRL